jgi:nucleotide-binding universal stress UspA family protein
MPRTIVIGSDGSEQAEAALRFGGALARAQGARVIVATAYEHMPPLRGDGGGFERLARADAQGIADRGAAALGDGIDVHARVASGGTLAQALHAIAEAEQADLLVVSTSSRAHIAGRQPGGVTEHVVHHSPCPVAVVPHSDREPAFARIGVAMDATPAARAAFDMAVGLAAACGEDSRLELVYVEPVNTLYPRAGLPGSARERHVELGWLDALTAETGGKASFITREGDPGEQLAKLSEELDVLVCGSRDQGPVRRLLLGSVSTHVVRHAHCPIVVVPASAHSPGADRTTPTGSAQA